MLLNCMLCICTNIKDDSCYYRLYALYKYKYKRQTSCYYRLYALYMDERSRCFEKSTDEQKRFVYYDK